jgi:hypothetical protein
VGTATVGAGAGTHPLYVTGRVFLAGPYGGSPLSLVVSVPAVSGPYDLGTVPVRVGVSVNPINAQITASSDPFPQILDGIPLRLRSVVIDLDRNGFTLNPTNCNPFATQSAIFGGEGGTASREAHFQVGNCAVLPFGPKLSLAARGALSRRGHPVLKAELSGLDGDSNIARAVVTLPNTGILDNSHLSNICTRVQYAAEACPADSVYGRAEARTPLLAEPLTGPVYLRASKRNLPDLVASLRGQLDFEVSAQIASTKAGAFRTTFDGLPDVPVSRVSLVMKGGKAGLLQNKVNLCGLRRPPRMNVVMTGQNGARSHTRPLLETACKKSPKSKRHLRRGQDRRGRAGR